MKLVRKAGATSNIFQIFIQDSSSTTGAGLTGLVYNSSSLTAYYHRDTDTTATAITLVTMTVGTFTSSGFKEIDATNMPGWYQFCPPDAAIAAGAKSCGFHLKGATNMAPLPLEVQLVAYDPDDAVHLGLSCLPNTAVTTNASLLTSGTGTDQLSVTSGRIDVGKLLGTAWLTPGTAGTPDVNVKLWNALTTVALPLVPTTAGRTLDVSAGGEAGVDWANVGSPTTSVNLSGTTVNLTNTVTTYTGNTPQTGDNYARIGAAGAGLTALGDTRIANLDATVSSRLATSGYTAPPTAAQNATAVLTTQMTESYAADGVAPTLTQAVMLTQQMATEKAVASTTLTVKKLDGSTSAATFTLNDATTPTSITRTT